MASQLEQRVFLLPVRATRSPGRPICGRVCRIKYRGVHSIHTGAFFGLLALWAS